jgi:lipopolysaccharide transport system ATP-binding protein
MDIMPSPATALTLQIFQPESGEYRDVVAVASEPQPIWRTLRAPLPPAVGPEARLEPARSAPATEAESGGEASEASLASTAPDRRAADVSQGPVSIREFSFLDEAGIERHTLVSGRSASIRFRACSALTIPEPIAVVAIYRPDGLCVSQMISRGESQTGRLVQGEFEIEAVLEEVLIGPGDYVVSAALFNSLDPTKSPEDRAYELLDRSFALKIVDSDFDVFPTGVVRQRARWSMRKLAHSKDAGVAGLLEGSSGDAR